MLVQGGEGWHKVALAAVCLVSGFRSTRFSASWEARPMSVLVYNDRITPIAMEAILAIGTTRGSTINNTSTIVVLVVFSTSFAAFPLFESQLVLPLYRSRVQNVRL